MDQVELDEVLLKLRKYIMPNLLGNIELYLYGHSKLTDEDNTTYC